MAETIDSEIHSENRPNNDMNQQTDLASGTETAKPQMVELQPLPSSAQPSDPSSSNFLPEQQEVVDDKVTIDMNKMIQDCGDGVMLSECCIYMVPLPLRHLNKEAYTPRLVSIGPFHFGNKRLQDMERHKQVMFKRFTQRTKSRMEDLVGLVRDLVPKVRASYSGTIVLAEHKLVKLTLTDAGFIIELFIMSCVETNEEGNDAKFSQPWLCASIIEDFLLLENQLPFFVIEELFNKAFPLNHDGSSRQAFPLNHDGGSRQAFLKLPSFLKLAYEYFDHFNRQKLEPNPEDVKIKHFTDLLRFFYLHEKKPKRDGYPEGEGSHILLYNANAMHEAGIKLKASKNKCLLDLKFSGHILEIPQTLVEDDTEALFRNMIALEQCHYPNDAYITDYALLLDCLIDTYKDVDLLIDKKIVRHYLGDSHNVASVFNGLWKNVCQSKFNSEYLGICQRLNGYCQNPRHKLTATLRRDYCNTPWRTVASIAGIILLVLTIVQTIFSVLQVALK